MTAPVPEPRWFGTMPIQKWTAGLTPVGKVLFLVAAAALAGGIYVGYAMHARSIGVDAADPAHPTIAELTAAHPVDCGTAFNRQFTSVLCDEALSNKKTLAVVLLITGGVFGVGSRMFKEPETQKAAPPSEEDGAAFRGGLSG